MVIETNNKTTDEIVAQLVAEVNHLQAAFIKDEYDLPDYTGHRIYHRKQAEDQINHDKSNNTIISNIKSWAIIGVITILLMQVLQYGPTIAAFLGK